MFEKYRDLEAYPDVLNLKDVANYVEYLKDSARKACIDWRIETYPNRTALQNHKRKFNRFFRE